jgi:hypothetical protein
MVALPGLLEEEPGKPKPFTNYIEDFANSMRDERGLSLATITFRREQIAHVLSTF